MLIDFLLLLFSQLYFKNVTSQLCFNFGFVAASLVLWSQRNFPSVSVVSTRCVGDFSRFTQQKHGSIDNEVFNFVNNDLCRYDFKISVFSQSCDVPLTGCSISVEIMVVLLL
jgi:hypothetical protein